MIFFNRGRNVYFILTGLSAIFDGLISVMSLGFFSSNITFRVAAALTIRELKKKICASSK